MKNKIYLLAFASLFVFASCESDDDSGNPGTNNSNPTTRQKIIGNWDGVIERSFLYRNGVLQSGFPQLVDLSTQEFNFNTDDSLYISNNGVLEDTDHWSLSNDSTILINGFEGKIHSLSNIEFEYSYSITAINGPDTLILELFYDLVK